MAPLTICISVKERVRDTVGQVWPEELMWWRRSKCFVHMVSSNYPTPLYSPWPRDYSLMRGLFRPCIVSPCSAKGNYSLSLLAREVFIIWTEQRYLCGDSRDATGVEYNDGHMSGWKFALSRRGLVWLRKEPCDPVMLWLSLMTGLNVTWLSSGRRLDLVKFRYEFKCG